MTSVLTAQAAFDTAVADALAAGVDPLLCYQRALNKAQASTQGEDGLSDFQRLGQYASEANES
jgi:hypothetical protein